MDKLLHDPRTKQQIKEALYEFLYGPLNKAFKAKLDIIIIKNKIATRSEYAAFIYKGEVYSINTQGLPRRAAKLADQFRPEMDEYLAEIKEIQNTEVPYVLGFINQVLNSTNELHDYLRVLPDAVHRPITSLISTCPCRAKSLTAEEAEEMTSKNKAAIQLIKQRLVNNLLQSS